MDDITLQTLQEHARSLKMDMEIKEQDAAWAKRRYEAVVKACEEVGGGN